MAENGWYYVDRDRRIGPLERSEMDRLVSTGEIRGNTLVWREGMDGWEVAGDHFATGKASAPPPMPQSSFQSQQTLAAHTGGDVGPDGLYAGAPSRSLGEAIRICFNKYVDFQGQASRSEFWFFILFGFLIGTAASILDLAIFGPYMSVSPINTIVTLALLLPNMAVTVRRLHDTDRSGWWYFGFLAGMVLFGFAIGASIASMSPYGNPEEGLIMMVGIGGIAVLAYMIVLIVFWCQKGTLGPNRFG